MDINYVHDVTMALLEKKIVSNWSPEQAISTYWEIYHTILKHDINANNTAYENAKH